jgi:hypothetical protein
MSIHRDADSYYYMVRVTHCGRAIVYSPKTALGHLLLEYFLYTLSFVKLQVMGYSFIKIIYQLLINIYPGYLTTSHGKTQSQGQTYKTQSKHTNLLHSQTSSIIKN